MFKNVLLCLFIFPLLFHSCSQRSLVIEKEPIIEEKVVVLKPHAKETIVIDAGHGGKDTGTLSEKNRYEEKMLTLQTAQMVKTFLSELGYNVVLTRETDLFVPLEKRAAIANNLQANLFVSIHYNFCQADSADGIEVFYYKGDSAAKEPRLTASRKLGEEVLARVVKHTGATSRGVKTANFAVIRETKMPAILIEGGFLSNPKEREKLKDPQYRRYLAWGIAKGVDNYLTSQKK